MLLWFGAYCEAEDMSGLGYVASPSRGNGLPQPQVGQLLLHRCWTPHQETTPPTL